MDGFSCEADLSHFVPASRASLLFPLVARFSIDLSRDDEEIASGERKRL